jgi:hypothetical protein
MIFHYWSEPLFICIMEENGQDHEDKFKENFLPWRFPLLESMVGKAESQAHKTEKASQAHDRTKKDLLDGYKAAVEKACLEGLPKPSICASTQKKGQRHLYSTITRLYNGGQTQHDANAASAHLTKEQEETLCEFIMSMADWGFPLTHDLMEGYALELIHVNRPHIQNLGQRWLDHYLTWYGAQISMTWGAPLDTVWANAVNPTSINGWFSLLENTVNEYNIKHEHTYGFDETGFPIGEGQPPWVAACTPKHSTPPVEVAMRISPSALMAPASHPL